MKRAKALPLVHPKFPDTFVPGVVTVIVVPETDAPNPIPNETTLRAVCAYLNAAPAADDRAARRAAALPAR